MRYNNLLSICVVGSLCVLGGCDNSTENTAAEAEPAEPTTVENKSEQYVSPLPDDAPVVRVSTDANYAPYEFKNEYGNVIGFDIDLIRKIGEKEGFKVEIYNDPWEEVFTNLENGSRDMIAAGLTYNEERAKKYALSNSYAPTPSAIGYVGEQNIDSLDDLSGKSMGVLENSSPYRFFTENSDYAVEVQTYPTVFLAVQAMLQDEVDVVAGDSGVIRHTLGGVEGISPKYFEYENITDDGARTHYALSKNNKELLKQLNQGIEAVKEDGTYAEITTKWFGTDLTDLSNQQGDALKKLEASASN